MLRNELMREKKVKERLKKRIERDRLRWRKHYEHRRMLHHDLRLHGSDILHSEQFLGTRAHVQHGTTSVHKHCKDVAETSLRINRFLHLNCDKRDLIRGALLHDYFLYDWHFPGHEDDEKLHGFHHPKLALRNAARDYELTKRQRDIIQKHMWPLTVVPPTTREAWVVTMADKYCSLLETIGLHKGRIFVPSDISEEEETE